LNPTIFKCSPVRAAALAQLGRAEEAAKAAQVLLGNFPGLTGRTALKEFPLENA